jgi:hypothetical protein
MMSSTILNMNKLPDTDTGTRITVFIEADLAKRFTELTRGSGVSGTSLLRKTLRSELDLLAALPQNSPRAEKVLRYLDTEGTGFSTSAENRTRFSITLDGQDARRLEQLCREKRVPRDGVIGCYVHFLVNEVLNKISWMLANPRAVHETVDETVDEPVCQRDGEASDANRAVPVENPYNVLHLDDEWIELVPKRSDLVTGAVLSLARSFRAVRPTWSPDKCVRKAVTALECDLAGEMAEEAQDK